VADPGVLRLIRGRIAIKLTLTLVGFVALTMLLVGLALNRSLESFAEESLEARLRLAAQLLVEDARDLIARGAAPEELDLFVRRVADLTGARATLIAADGRLLAESGISAAELARLAARVSGPEVATALSGRQARDLRPAAAPRTALLYVALPLRDSAGVIGALRLGLPVAAATSLSDAMRRVMLASGLVAVAVAFAIGLFVARRVTRPVVEMQTTARRMSEGDFAVQVPVRSPDEIGALGRALNVMASRLRDKIRDLEQEQAKATAILDGMVEGVIAVDGHNLILLMNERARAMFALGPAQAAGRPFLEVIRNADLHEVLRQSRAEDGLSRRELRLSTPVERRLQVNAVRLALGGDDVGAVMVLHDVTELRRLEQVRTEFVANVSHELRTPLTAIQGYLETLLGGALEEPEHARKFLEIAFRHTERLGRLLNDLTDLSNIELGKTSLRLDPVALLDVVDSVLAIIRPRAEAGAVTLTCEVPRDLPLVRADHDRLAQILINLVDNAVKYTPRGHGVWVRAQPAGGGMVTVSVVDTGVGIPRADLARVTERFYRVDKARSRELGGTGLGLAIVKHLVLAHGGELTIDSEAGRGTAVTFTLRAVE
jgi:two-component system phosphate regulon sensor histidine kinase PhoR